MEPEKPVDPEVQKRADRHIVILYAVMIFLVALPFLVWAVKNWLSD